MKDGTNLIYSSKIIKAGALLADTKTMLANWDETAPVLENLARFRRNNTFGKASRSRIEDILAIFRQRYLSNEHVTKALVALVGGNFPTQSLTHILYFHTARSDSLLHDIVTKVLANFHIQRHTEVTVEDICTVVSRWVDERKTTSHWSEYTIRRVAQGILSTLRDFGVLQGAANKRLAPIYLSVEAFVYIAFYLSCNQQSSDRLIHDTEWQLFFMSPSAVERLFMEAHQHHLLEYRAAGSVVRIDFPTDSLEEYAYALVERTY